MNERKTAHSIIYKTLSDKAYTNLLMRQEIRNLDQNRRAFVNNLVHGVLKNYDYLLYNCEKAVKKGSLKNKLIIMMAIYERFYLGKPEYVVVNEYVNLADSQFDKGFINSVLRNFKQMAEPDEPWIKNNLPKWLYSLLAKQYSSEEFSLILKNYARIPTVYYHVNHKKADIHQFKDINIINEDIFTSEKSLIGSDDFNNGFYYIQDINSACLINDLDLKKDDTFLDVCSAPGSKLFNALKYVDENNAYANDLYETRVGLIRNKAQILGYESINYLNIDATQIGKNLDMKFDKILLDVPCSGLGVIGRKPDIRFHIQPESLDELERVQARILDSASELLKNEGLLLYSTCTLNKKENRRQIDNFLKTHQNFNLIKDATIINFEGDMFYHCLLKKV